MAKQTRVNLLPDTATHAMWELKDFLINDLGFVGLESGDGLAVYSGSPAFSSETLTGTLNFSDTETVTIDSKVYQFQTTLTDVDGNVQIGGTLADSLQNLYNAVNLEGTPGTDYATSMTIHPTCRARSLTATTLDAVAYQPGTAGDSISVSETASNASWGAASLSGGGGGDILTTGDSGANGMNNNDAWIRVGSPGFAAGSTPEGYEWLFQRNNSNDNYEVVYSALDRFTGGSPSSTSRPTATDEQALVDGQLFNATNQSYRVHIVGFDTPIGTAVPIYSWYLVAVRPAGPRTLIMHEAMAAGSYPELTGTRATPTDGDPDPSIQAARYNAADDDSFRHDDGFDQLTATNGSSPWKGWFGMNGTNGNTENYTTYNGFYYYFSESQAWTLGPRRNDAGGVKPFPNNGERVILPVLVGRPARFGSQVGSKGFTANFRWNTEFNQYPDTIDVNGERFVAFGDLFFPFENGTLAL